MTLLGPVEIVYCVVVVITAFAVRGGAGFGGGAVATPLLVLILPPQVVIPAITVLNFLSSLGHGFRNWGKVEWKEVLRVTPFTLAGVGVGLYVLSQLDPKPLSRALGAFVAIYAVYALLTAGRAPRVKSRWQSVLMGAVSSAAGFVGTVFGGAAGPIYAMYFGALRLERDVFRVTITTVMLFLSVYRMTGYASFGLFNESTLMLLAIAFPPMLIGAFFGERIVRRFDQQRFYRAVAVVMLVSGLALLLK